MKKISIIIPAYNAETFIERCITSIESCYDEQVEIIIVDDGSSDGTPFLCKSMVASRSNIRYIRQNNAGVSTARNRGVDESKGEYLLFMDSDDYLCPGAIGDLLESVVSSVCDVVYFGYVRMLAGTDNVTVLPYLSSVSTSRRNSLLDYFEEACVNGADLNRHVWGWMVKRSLICEGKLRFDKYLTWAEDFDFCMEISRAAESIATINKPLYTYFNNDKSVTKTIKARHLLSEMKVSTKWISFLSEDNRYPKLCEYFSEFFCNSLSLLDKIVDDPTPAVKYARVHFDNMRFVRSSKYRIAVCIWSVFGIVSGSKILTIISKIIK